MGVSMGGEIHHEELCRVIIRIAGLSSFLYIE